MVELVVLIEEMAYSLKVDRPYHERYRIAQDEVTGSFASGRAGRAPERGATACWKSGAPGDDVSGAAGLSGPRLPKTPRRMRVWASVRRDDCPIRMLVVRRGFP